MCQLQKACHLIKIVEKTQEQYCCRLYENYALKLICKCLLSFHVLYGAIPQNYNFIAEKLYRRVENTVDNFWRCLLAFKREYKLSSLSRSMGRGKFLDGIHQSWQHAGMFDEQRCKRFQIYLSPEWGKANCQISTLTNVEYTKQCIVWK